MKTQDSIVQADENKSNNANKKRAPRATFANKKIMLALVVLLAVLGTFGTVVFYNKYQDVKQDPTQVQKAQNSADTQRVLTELKKVLRVDETEAPTVARVEDPAKLKKANAEFYKNVDKGDYLIIFPKRAIIYREQTNQLINIAPIVDTRGTTQSDAQTTDTKSTTGASNGTTKTTSR